MAGAARFSATSMIAILAATPVTAADLATPMEPLPPPPPIFFVHAGALGAFAETNAQATGGGSFGGAENVAIRPVYTLVLEAGYYVTPNVALLSAPQFHPFRISRQLACPRRPS